MKAIVLCLLLIVYVSMSSARMLEIKDVKLCDPNKKYPITIVTKRKYEGDILLQDWKFQLDIPFSDKLGWSLIAARIYGNKTRKLLDLKNKNGGGCTALVTYGGEKVREIAKVADVDLKCPISKSPIHIKWYDFDLDIDLVKLVPKGSYMATIKFFDEGTEVICVLAYLDKN